MNEKFYLFKTLKYDLSRLTNPDLKGFVREYFFPRGNMFRFIFWFRVMMKVKRIKAKFLAPFLYLIYRHYEFKYQIHANTNIHVGKGLKIVHGDGVHLNACFIGDSFTCYQGVTLGEKDGGVPYVEDNVTIYPNAVIVGGVTLHSGAVIGANAFVNRDIPANEIWGGVPAKRIK